MEALNLSVLKSLAESRNITPAKQTREAYIKALKRKTKTPYGINLNDNPVIIVAELRQIPYNQLKNEAIERGIEFDTDNPSYGEIITNLLQEYNIPDLETVVNEVDTYWKLPYRQLQHLTGMTTSNRLKLVVSAILDTNNTNTHKELTLIDEFLKAGVKRVTYIHPRELKPLNLLSANSTQMVGAVENGKNLMELLRQIPSMPMGALNNAEQALLQLNMNYNSTAPTIKDRYVEYIEYLTQLAKYPPAKWWPTIREYFVKLTPLQRRNIAEELGLLSPDDTDITDADVNFRLTRGIPLPSTNVNLIYKSLPKEVYQLLTTRYKVNPEEYKGKRSSVEHILLELAITPDDNLRKKAKEYGIRLPIINPRETLYDTIFLYEWINPNREPIYTTLLHQPVTKELLREYDDFELMSVWPGFKIDAPQNRRELISTCLTELTRDHYFSYTDSESGLAFGTYLDPQPVPVVTDPNELQSIDIPEDRQLQLQLARTCTRLSLGDDFFSVIEADAIGYLVNPWIDVPIGKGHDEVDDYLSKFLSLAMIAFGWDGTSSRMDIEQKEDIKVMVTSALNSLPPVPVEILDLKLITYNDNADIEETDITLPEVKKIINAKNASEYAIMLVQTACYYYPKLLAQLPEGVNPFVY